MELLKINYTNRIDNRGFSLKDNTTEKEIIINLKHIVSYNTKKRRTPEY